jgi:hypothetical protein
LSTLAPSRVKHWFRPATPAAVARAIAATAARDVADVAGLYDRSSTEVAERYEQTIAAKDETIAALRRRAEVAEAERDEVRHQVATPPGPRR